MPQSRIFLQGKHVEAAVVAGEFGMMVEKSPCACNDFLLLACSDAGGRAAKIRAVAKSYFGKYQQRWLLHDEINLALAAVVVGADKAKAVCLQKVTGSSFSCLSVLMCALPLLCYQVTRVGWQFHC